MGYNLDNDISPLTKPAPSRFIQFGDTEASYIEVIPTPGHSPGHLSYAFYDDYSSTSTALYCGDVVFENGIGRYDFPDSNYEDLQKSIDMVKRFPAIQIYPGHGESFFR